MGAVFSKSPGAGSRSTTEAYSEFEELDCGECISSITESQQQQTSSDCHPSHSQQEGELEGTETNRSYDFESSELDSISSDCDLADLHRKSIQPFRHSFIDTGSDSGGTHSAAESDSIAADEVDGEFTSDVHVARQVSEDTIDGTSNSKPRGVLGVKRFSSNNRAQTQTKDNDVKECCVFDVVYEGFYAHEDFTPSAKGDGLMSEPHTVTQRNPSHNDRTVAQEEVQLPSPDTETLTGITESSCESNVEVFTISFAGMSMHSGNGTTTKEELHQDDHSTAPSQAEGHCESNVEVFTASFAGMSMHSYKGNISTEELYQNGHSTTVTPPQAEDRISENTNENIQPSYQAKPEPYVEVYTVSFAGMSMTVCGNCEPDESDTAAVNEMQEILGVGATQSPVDGKDV